MMVSNSLIDPHGRKHNYLRISLTDHCNLRCFYCMPEEGIEFQEKSSYLTRSEIFEVAKTFVQLGVNKIRITGGEPLVRKRADEILRDLASLPIELAITTNGILLDRYLPLFKEIGLTNINVSLDSLNEEKNLLITKRDYYQKIRNNISLLLDEGITPKLNVVVMRDINQDEIIDFIELTKHSNLDVRFLEFMPFNGNKWKLEKCFSYQEILTEITNHYGDQINKLEDSFNSTSKNYKVSNYQGSFGIISSITNPFCEGCNRIRLTADGNLKNCLFSTEEFDILTPLREGSNIVPIIEDCLSNKKAVKAGIQTTDNNIETLEQNRSMISIGG
ncbi:MAG: GTP 3',8-cyclase MoaA [Bacteroidia bacterium]|nr:GTP 3',8-cyclase MoaA [Bacteroidia bacterium]